MGGCQNYGPFWGTLNIRCRIIIGIQKGILVLTTTRIDTYIDIYIYIDTFLNKVRAWLRRPGQHPGTPAAEVSVSVQDLQCRL